MVQQTEKSQVHMKRLKFFFIVTDIGFLIYWMLTLFHLIPKQYLFKDYENPILVSWNWSFMPLDLLISATGLTSIYLYQRANQNWIIMAIISLTLTFCSGLQAISFWVLRSDFDWMWWFFNLYLLLYPLAFFKPMGLALSSYLQKR